MQNIFRRICQANEKLTFNLKFVFKIFTIHLVLILLSFYNKKHIFISHGFKVSWGIDHYTQIKVFLSSKQISEFRLFFLEYHTIFCFVLLSKILGHQSLKNSESIRSIQQSFFQIYHTTSATSWLLDFLFLNSASRCLVR